jgi:hypothetical protein
MILDFGFWIADFKFWISNFGLWISRGFRQVSKFLTLTIQAQSKIQNLKSKIL